MEDVVHDLVLSSDVPCDVLESLEPVIKTASTLFATFTISKSHVKSPNSPNFLSSISNLIHLFKTYNPLVSSLAAVRTLDVKDKDLAVKLLGHPDSSGRLLYLVAFGCFEFSSESVVEESALPIVLGSNDARCEIPLFTGGKESLDLEF